MEDYEVRQALAIIKDRVGEIKQDEKWKEDIAKEWNDATDAENGEASEDGYGTVIKEMKPTDQIIIVQAKGNTNELHEIWYGNGLDFTIIDRE